MLQSRPVTSAGGNAGVVEEHAGAVLLRGLGAAPGAASGPARVLGSLSEVDKFHDGDVLVTRMTAPDWVPLMRRAAAIATDSGGMTCHAAIVSRELGIPCIVGTRTATETLRDGEVVTVDATRGIVLEGALIAKAKTPVISQPAAPVGDRDEPAPEPLRAVAGRTGGRARRRRRRAAARRADADRGARGHGIRGCCSRRAAAPSCPSGWRRG